MKLTQISVSQVKKKHEQENFSIKINSIRFINYSFIKHIKVN